MGTYSFILPMQNIISPMEHSYLTIQFIHGLLLITILFIVAGSVRLYFIYYINMEEMVSIFIVRYISVLFTTGLILSYAKKTASEKNPLTYLYIIIFILSSMAGIYQKPEIFSFIFINLIVWLYFNIKLDVSIKKISPWKLYVFPVIILIWVNCHGVFTFGMFFLALICFGEIINYLCYRKRRKNNMESDLYENFPLKHLFFSIILSGIAIFITPYGYKYPVGLLYHKKEQFINISAYNNILAPSAGLFHYLEFFIFMAITLLFVFYYIKIRKTKIDFSLILINLFFGYIFTIYLRSTYYWPAVFIYTVLYLQKDLNYLSIKNKITYTIKTLVIVYFLFLSGRAIYESLCMPFKDLWSGFGTGYQNPVVETEFMKKYHPGKTLMNDYGSGGYLLWELYPEYKVSMDPRGFPYDNAYFVEHQKFFTGAIFDDFLKKYPFDVVMIGLGYQLSIQHFNNSPGWKLAFYGPSAAIFVKKEINLPEDSQYFMPDRFKNIKNLQNLIDIFSFNIDRGNIDEATYVLEINKKHFICPCHSKIIKSLDIYRDALVAYNKSDYEKSLTLFETCKKGKGPWNQYILNRLYRRKSLELAKKGDFKGSIIWEEKYMKDSPEDMSGLFNTGVLSYIIEKKEGKSTLSWQSCLQKFIETSPEDSNTMEAKNLLEGRTIKLYLITYPGEDVMDISSVL